MNFDWTKSASTTDNSTRLRQRNKSVDISAISLQNKVTSSEKVSGLQVPRTDFFNTITLNESSKKSVGKNILQSKNQLLKSFETCSGQRFEPKLSQSAVKFYKTKHSDSQDLMVQRKKQQTASGMRYNKLDFDIQVPYLHAKNPIAVKKTSFPASQSAAKLTKSSQDSFSSISFDRFKVNQKKKYSYSSQKHPLNLEQPYFATQNVSFGGFRQNDDVRYKENVMKQVKQYQARSKSPIKFVKTSEPQENHVFTSNPRIKVVDNFVSSPVGKEFQGRPHFQHMEKPIPLLPDWLNLKEPVIDLTAPSQKKVTFTKKESSSNELQERVKNSIAALIQRKSLEQLASGSNHEVQRTSIHKKSSNKLTLTAEDLIEQAREDMKAKKKMEYIKRVEGFKLNKTKNYMRSYESDISKVSQQKSMIDLKNEVDDDEMLYQSETEDSVLSDTVQSLVSLTDSSSMEAQSVKSATQPVTQVEKLQQKPSLTNLPAMTDFVYNEARADPQKDAAQAVIEMLRVGRRITSINIGTVNVFDNPALNEQLITGYQSERSSNIEPRKKIVSERILSNQNSSKQSQFKRRSSTLSYNSESSFTSILKTKQQKLDEVRRHRQLKMTATAMNTIKEAGSENSNESNSSKTSCEEFDLNVTLTELMSPDFMKNDPQRELYRKAILRKFIDNAIKNEEVRRNLIEAIEKKKAIFQQTQHEFQKYQRNLKDPVFQQKLLKERLKRSPQQQVINATFSNNPAMKMMSKLRESETQKFNRKNQFRLKIVNALQGLVTEERANELINDYFRKLSSGEGFPNCTLYTDPSEIRAISVINQFKERMSSRDVITVSSGTHTFRSENNSDEFPAYRTQQNLPIPSKIQLGTLALQDYTLSSQQVSTLARVFSNNDTNIKNFFLSKCNVSDTDLSSLLGALEGNDFIERVFVRQNDFSDFSLNKLKPLLVKQSPHLLELRLYNCKTSAVVIQQLAQFLGSTEEVRLNAFSLVSAPLNERAVHFLSQYVTNSQFLLHLDLSSNDMKPMYIKVLLKAIEHNTRLRSLNLSYNSLMDAKEEILDDSAVLGRRDERIYSVSDQKEQMEREANRKFQMPQLVLKCLGSFIRHNKQLLHLDLTSTGLSLQVLMDLVPCIRRAKSMVSLHASQNPGSNAVKKFWMEKLKCKAPDEKRFEVMQRDDKTLERPRVNLAKISSIKLQSFEFPNKKDEEKELKQKKMMQIEGNILSYISKLRTHSLYSMNDESATEVLVLTRKLGHRIDMPGSGQWTLQEPQIEANKTCYVCDKWPYTLLVWNPRIGQKKDRTGIRIVDKERQRIVQTLKQVNSNFLKKITNDEKMQLNQPPFLVCESNNWKAQEMVPLLSFIEKVTGGKPQYIKNIEAALATHEDQAEVGKEDSYDNQKRLAARNNWVVKLMIQHFKKKVRAAYIKVLFRKWTFLLKDSSVHELCLLNDTELREDDFEHTHVIPLFLKPGKHHMFVGSHKQTLRRFNLTDLVRENEHFHFFYHRHVAMPTQEYLNPFAKRLKTTLFQRKFRKELSVFARWKMDTYNRLNECFQHDVKFWKVPRIVKVAADYNQVVKIVQDNYFELKEIYILLAAQCNEYPGIGLLEYTRFCEKAGIIDKHVCTANLDIMFIASNIELVDSDQMQNEANSLMRFEFLEILVRIAKAKYLETKKVSTIGEALQTLLSKHILPTRSDIVLGSVKESRVSLKKIMNLVSNPKEPRVLQGQEFRDKYMWNLPINDLLDANLKGLQQVYDRLKMKTYLKQVPRSVIMDFLNIDCQEKLKLSILQTQISFALCKMTILDENLSGPVEYNCIHFVEFLELICRVAWFKHENEAAHAGQPINMREKVEEVIDILFEHVKVTRENVEFHICEETESDEDY